MEYGAEVLVQVGGRVTRVTLVTPLQGWRRGAGGARAWAVPRRERRAGAQALVGWSVLRDAPLLTAAI